MCITYLSVLHASTPHCKSERILFCFFFFFCKKKEIEETERSYPLEEFDFDCEVEIASVCCEVDNDT